MDKHVPLILAARSDDRAPVRRNSLEIGSFEDRFWRTDGRAESDRILKAASLFADHRRRERQTMRSGLGRRTLGIETNTLTGSAMRLFQELCAMTRNFDGKVFPSYDHLARATGLARATIARALNRLKALGFLIVQRRCARVTAEGPGPRFAQASNAYRVEMPEQAARLLPRTMQPAPVPCDDLHRRASAKFEAREMQKPWPVAGGFKVGDRNLADTLNRLAARLMERESQFEPEPLLNNLYSCGKMSSPGRRTGQAVTGQP